MVCVEQAVHDFCLLDADGKPKVVTCFRKLIHADLHLGFGTSIEDAVISKQEISQYCFLHPCDGPKSS